MPRNARHGRRIGPRSDAERRGDFQTKAGGRFRPFAGEVPIKRVRDATAGPFTVYVELSTASCGALARHGDRWRPWYGPCGHPALGTRRAVAISGLSAAGAVTLPVCGVHARGRWLRVDLQALAAIPEALP
jgi:hypothetical protein